MKTLDIHTPGNKIHTVQPVPRSKLEGFTKAMTELQALWLNEACSTGDTVVRDDAWDLMQRIVAELPNHLNPVETGFDLKLISNDYEQLERLFFGKVEVKYDATGTGLWDLTTVEGAALWELHHINPKKKLLLADAMAAEIRLNLAKSQAETSPPKTSQSKAQATKPATPSPTSSEDSE